MVRTAYRTVRKCDRTVRRMVHLCYAKTRFPFHQVHHLAVNLAVSRSVLLNRLHSETLSFTLPFPYHLPFCSLPLFLLPLIVCLDKSSSDGHVFACILARSGRTKAVVARNQSKSFSSGSDALSRSCIDRSSCTTCNMQSKKLVPHHLACVDWTPPQSRLQLCS